MKGGNSKERECRGPGCPKEKDSNIKEFLKCSRCKSMWYCSKSCQAAHWKSGHSKHCNAPNNTITTTVPKKDESDIPFITKDASKGKKDNLEVFYSDYIYNTILFHWFCIFFNKDNLLLNF